MNYIKEINAFYDLQEQVPLSGAGVALWYALMHINNKTRWKNTFTSPGSVLQNKAGISESSFKRARTELKERGFIEVESQGRGKAPVYTMKSLVVEWNEDGHAYEMGHEQVGAGDVEKKEQGLAVERELESRSRNEAIDSRVDQGMNQERAYQVDGRVTHVPTQLADHLLAHDPAPLVKQYKTITKPKQNNKHAAAVEGAQVNIFTDQKKNQSTKNEDAVVFYQENFGVASPFVMEALLDWIHSLGEELVMEAMKRALERNKTSWGYVKSILKAWDKKGIRTVRDAEAEQVAFEKERRKKNRGSEGFFAVKEDIVPDWYEGEKQRQKEVREREGEKEDQEAMQAEVEVLLREYMG